MLCLSVRNLKSIVGDFVVADNHIDVGDFCIPKSQILAICNKTVYYWQYTVIGEVATVKHESGIPVYVTSNGVTIYAFDPSSICLTSVEPSRLSSEPVSKSVDNQVATGAAVAAATGVVASSAAASEPSDEDDFLDDESDKVDDSEEEFSIDDDDDVDHELDSSPEFGLDDLDEDEDNNDDEDEDDDASSKDLDEDDFFDDEDENENAKQEDEDEFDLDEFEDDEDPDDFEI